MKKNSSLLVWFIHASPFILKTIFLGFLGGLLYVAFISDPTGYCGEKKRFLSDEEFIEIALRDAYGSGRMKIDGSDASIVGAYAQHRNCCRVYRKTQSFIDRILNINVVDILMYYEVNEKEFKTEPKDGEFYESHMRIGACGRVYESFGMRTGREYLPSWFN